MKIGIFGSGTVARTLGAKLASLGHAVMLGTRDPGKLQEWQASQPALQLGSLAQTAIHGEVLLNATAGMASLAALEAAGAEHMQGKILIDLANPLDFSQGFPPSLSVANTDSLGEQIQRAFPDVRVVKTLNTVAAPIMIAPQQLAGGDHHLFVSGNDPQARAQVSFWLREWFGWQQIVDLGDISTARGTEMLLPIWVRLMGVLQTPMFGFKIVRNAE